MKINTLIIKNKSILSEGLCTLLEQDNVYQVATISLEAFLTASKEAIHTNSIIIVALPLESSEYKSLLSYLKLLEIPAMLVMPTSTISDFQQVVKHKVKGYLSFSSDYEEFTDAIHAIVSGATYYSKELIAQLKLVQKQASTKSDKKFSAHLKISKRELEIIRLLQQGLQSKLIAEALGISDRTVAKHRENIMKKCNVTNVTELLYFLQKNELFLPIF
jgi:DNA-binding NarL/FixJ family response regulator